MTRCTPTRRGTTLEAQQVWTPRYRARCNVHRPLSRAPHIHARGSARISANTQMLFMARAIERIGDRATNIAEIVRYLVGGTPVEEERPKADATKSILLSTPSSQ